MTQIQGRSGTPTKSLIAIIAIAIIAAAGWGACAYSALSSMDLERKLSGQMVALREYQAQCLLQRRTAEEGRLEITKLREQLASAKHESERLASEHKATEVSLMTAREQLASFQKIHASPALDGAPALRGITPLPTRQDVLAAQKALSRLGFGELEADGIVGPTTRQAIEEFQRVTGLTITGELHAQTLQSLMRSEKVVRFAASALSNASDAP